MSYEHGGMNMGKHEDTSAVANTREDYVGKHRANENEPGGFRVGSQERFDRLNKGGGDWFTER